LPLFVVVEFLTAQRTMMKVRRTVTYELDVSAVVKHQILRLEVAVDDTLGMKILERLNDARHAEPCRHVVKVTPTTQQSHQLHTQLYIRLLFSAMFPTFNAYRQHFISISSTNNLLFNCLTYLFISYNIKLVHGGLLRLIQKEEIGLSSLYDVTAPSMVV